MPLRKDFSGKKEYKDRNVFDDFLELLPPSTNETIKGKSFIPTMPCLKVGDGLYNNGNLLRDANISSSGLVLFRRWFSQRNRGTPLSNVWDFDVGQLIVPGVFMDKDLLIALAKRYDPILQVVRNLRFLLLQLERLSG